MTYYKFFIEILYVFYRNIGHSMHSFGDDSANISQRSKLDIFHIEDDLLSNFRPFIF